MSVYTKKEALKGFFGDGICSVCGEKMAIGGYWACEKDITLCTNQECIDSILHLVIDAYMSREFTLKLGNLEDMNHLHSKRSLLKHRLESIFWRKMFLAKTFLDRDK